MDVSVVVPTLNDRETLTGCLDSLADEDPTEVIVVNGPSTDGTTGMVRDRDDVDVLVEIDERNVNVARNAGLDRVKGDAVAFVAPSLHVDEGWFVAVVDALSETAVATGPIHQQLRASVTSERVESITILDRTVTYFEGGNVAFSMAALEAIDGFDENLEIGGARDAAHGLASFDFDVEWVPRMSATVEAATDGGNRERDWHQRYRSLSYRLIKNYGVHPTVPYRIASHAGRDSVSVLRSVVDGETPATNWFGNGRDVISGIGRGYVDGVRVRYLERSPSRNPAGWSSRTDRAVTVYDRR